MDEISALRFIFKDLNVKDNGELEIHFNNKTYNIDSLVRSEKDFLNPFDYVLRKESEIQVTKKEVTKEVSANNVESKRITETQFMDWLSKINSKKEKKSVVTGRMYWETTQCSEIDE